MDRERDVHTLNKLADAYSPQYDWKPAPPPPSDDAALVEECIHAAGIEEWDADEAEKLVRAILRAIAAYHAKHKETGG